MPRCHTQTHATSYTHTRLLSGKQSQHHGVTETKPQKRRLALCDNPLTHIYIQGLVSSSVPPSPPPCRRRCRPCILSLLPFGLPPDSPVFLPLFLPLLHLVHHTQNTILSSGLLSVYMALHGSFHRLARARALSDSEYQGFLQAGKKAALRQINRRP